MTTPHSTHPRSRATRTGHENGIRVASDTARMAANDFSEFEVVPDDRSEVQKLGDDSAVDGAVDIPTLKCCFPKVFEVFKDREDWVILGALEAAGMDEAKAIRNLKAKIRQAKQLVCRTGLERPGLADPGSMLLTGLSLALDRASI